ncbi:Charged multivesicular body protein 7, partial [Stegodyphus mimosarum]
MALKLNFNECDLPRDWEDDVRMNFLFSTFRERTVNPEGWDAKMKFWITLIVDICKKSSSPLINKNILCSSFQRKGRFPVCLDTVLEHMASQGFIVNMSEFSRIENEKGWLGWGYDVLVQKPVSWGFSTVQHLLKWDKKDEHLVVLPVVKDLASRIYRHHCEVTDSDSDSMDDIMFLSNFEEECKNICTGTNFQLAVIQLQKDKNASVFEECGKKVIRFRRMKDEQVQNLSAVARGVLNLRATRNSLLEEIDKLEQDILGCTVEVKHLMKTGCKTKAMVALKRKKRLESLLNKKTAALDNIEQFLCQLQNSGSEKKVLDAYQAGLQAMKAVGQKLNLDAIDEAMDEIGQVLDECAEVQKTLSKPVTPDDEDLQEFENELEELLADEENVSPEVKKPVSPAANSYADLMKRLEALRAPPDDVPP